MEILKTAIVDFDLIKCDGTADSHLVEQYLEILEKLGCCPFVMPCFVHPAKTWGDEPIYEIPSCPKFVAMLAAIATAIDRDTHPDRLLVQLCETIEDAKLCASILA